MLQVYRHLTVPKGRCVFPSLLFQKIFLRLVLLPVRLPKVLSKTAKPSGSLISDEIGIISGVTGGIPKSHGRPERRPKRAQQIEKAGKTRFSSVPVLSLPPFPGNVCVGSDFHALSGFLFSYTTFSSGNFCRRRKLLSDYFPILCSDNTAKRLESSQRANSSYQI